MREPIIEQPGSATVLERLLRWIAGTCLRHRGRTVAACLAVVTLLASRIPATRIDNSLEAHFAAGDPVLADYHHFLDTFGGDQFISVVLEGVDPFSGQGFATVRGLTEALIREVPHLADPDRAVTSVAHGTFIDGRAEAVEILRPEDHDIDAAFLDRLRRTLTGEAFARNVLINEKADATAIVLRFNPRRDELPLAWDAEATTAVYRVLASDPFAPLHAHVVGLPVLGTMYGQLTARETSRHAGVMLLVLCLLLFLFFRRLSAVAITLAVVFAALLIVFGLLATFSRMGILSGILPPLILSIGTCAAIHLLAATYLRREEGQTPTEAIEHAVLYAGPAVFLASLTTACGFVALTAAPIRSVRATGLLAAAGTLAAFLLSVTLLPALLHLALQRETDRRPKPARGFDRRLRHGLCRLVAWDLRHPGAVLLVSALLVSLAATGIPRLATDTNLLKKIDPANPVSQAYAFVDRHMGGSASLEVVLDSTMPEGFGRLADMVQLERTQAWLAHQPGVTKAVSAADLVRSAHRAFHGGDGAQDRLPDTQAALRQILLVGECVLAEELGGMLSADHRQARISVRLRNMSDGELRRLVGALDAYARQTLPDHLTLHSTGAARLTVRTMKNVWQGQRRGFLLAFGVIGALLALHFRSLRVALVAMIPNVVPIVVSLGWMGYRGIPLDISMMMVGTIAIGIAVDDTIHLFDHCRKALAEGMDHRQALLHVARGTGAAISTTTVVLMAGFLVLCSSSMQNIATFGMVSALTIGVAWLADVFIAPALIFLLRPFGVRR